LDKLEDELEVWSAKSNPELGTNLKEDELDCLSQSFEFGLMDWRQGALEGNMPNVDFAALGLINLLPNFQI
jgi:hypothetical protein